MNIEQIIFRPVGDYPYKLKKVIGLRPDPNVFGLIKIAFDYYEKVYL